LNDNGYGDDVAVGVARLALTEGSPAIMARVAIKKDSRGLGIASKLIESIIVKAGQLSINCIEIHAHEYLKEYYEGLVFNILNRLKRWANTN